MNVILDWVLARLQERSTWLGLISVLSSLGVALNPQLTQLIIVLGVAISGGVCVFTKDHSVADAVEKALAAGAAAETAQMKAPATVAPPVPPEAPAQ